jgi:hypothetical protein
VEGVALAGVDLDDAEGLLGGGIEAGVHHPANPAPGIFDFFDGVEALDGKLGGDWSSVFGDDGLRGGLGLCGYCGDERDQDSKSNGNREVFAGCGFQSLSAFLDSLLANLRKRKSPRLLTGRGWVRERLEAVEMPLNRTKKSQKARKRFVLFLAVMGKNLG